MDRNDFVQRFPLLFHMATGGSWPSIREHGLRTTEDLVATAGLSAEDQEALLRRRRPASVAVEHPQFGTVWIRDQRPLRLDVLKPKLTDVSVADWLALLNGRVFFWPTEEKLHRLLGATMYRAHEQDVLTVDSAALLSAVGDRVQLSPINSGSALYPNAAFRGSRTFTTIEEYDFHAQRRRRGWRDALVEVAVVGGLPDVARFVVTVQRWRGTELLTELPI